MPAETQDARATLYEVPTLLVGLGGTGTRIVDMVYGMADPSTRSMIAVHGFDTDIGDLRKLHNIRDHLTQTSDAMTVWQCRRLCRGNIDNWAQEILNYRESPLARKSMPDGAAQVRMISRLAYYWTMQEHGLRKLEDDVARLFKVDGRDFRSSVRVIVVSTLAGGTGAGIFLQAALYIRHLLETRFHQNAVVMRGHFLLPDLFVKTGVTRPEESDDLRANAYASLKELNGIIQSIRGSGQQNTIDLEFMPGQDNLAVDRIPYDSVFLFDNENADNKSLGTGQEGLRRYVKQAAESLFLQLFTPIGEENRSQEDNLLRDAIRNDGLNLYAGCGVAKLVYPFQDILRYCGCRAVQDSLAGKWLLLDRMYQEELKRYIRAQNRGDLREKPLRSRFFLREMENRGGIGSHDPFFTPLFKATQHLDKQNRSTGAKSFSFLRAIDEELRTRLANNRDYQEHLVSLKDFPREKKLRDRQQIRSEVQETEDRLAAFRQLVLYELIPESVSPLLYAVMQEDADAENCLTAPDPYRLNTWLLKQPEPMHPLAVRYFFYDLEQLLETELLDLREKTEQQKKIIARYNEVYDDPATPDILETPEVRAERAARQSRLAALLGRGELKQFAEEYLAESTKMRDALAAHTHDRILLEVYEGLLTAVQEFSHRWEQFFQDLDVEEGDLDAEIRMLSRKHSDAVDPTCHFILAAAEDKQQAWQRVRETYSANESGISRLWEQLYCNLYKSFTRGYWDSLGAPGAGSREQFSLVENLLTYHLGELAQHSLLNAPLVQVLRRNELDPVGLIREVARRASPWLYRPLGGGRELTYWGIHPDNNELLTSDERERAFQEAHCIVENNFNPHELVCYTSLYGLTAETMQKFQNAGLDGRAGSYFRSYQNKRNALISDPGRNITPHLDKWWHLAAYLPDLNQDFAQIDSKKRKDAFLYGLIYRYLRCYERDGRRLWQNFFKTFKDIKVHTHPVEEGYYNLFSSLAYNPGIVDGILAAAEKQHNDDLKEYGAELQQHKIFTGSVVQDDDPAKKSTLFDCIWSFAKEQPARNMRDDMEELVTNLVDLYFSYARSCYPQDRINESNRQAEKHIRELKEKSSSLKNMDEGTREAWEQIITNAIRRNSNQ